MDKWINVLEQTRKEAAFENACDCLYYGYGKEFWNACGLDDTEATKVWNKAFKKMSKEN